MSNQLRAQGLSVQRDEASDDLLVSDRRGSTSRLRLDDHGRVAHETTSMGRRFSYRYDPDGRLIEFAGAEGNLLNFAYNTEGRIELMKRSERSWKLDWTESGGLARIVYPDGTESKVTFSGPANPEVFTMRDGRAIHIERDQLSRITSITDPRGSTTQYEYSRWNLADRVIHADGSAESFIRNESGWLHEAHLNGKKWAELDFDANKNLTRIAGDDAVTSFTYDADGHVTVASNECTTVKREYDQDGRLLEEDQGGAIVRFTYDNAGLLRTIRTDVDEVLQFFYDGDGRLEQVEDWNGGRHKFSFDATGTEVQHVHPNGAITITTLDSDRRPVEIRTNGLRSLRYEYDTNDRISLLEDSGFGTRRYSYSPEGALLDVSRYNGAPLEHYRYDPAENCIDFNGREAEYGPMNELLRLGEEEIEYDERGNIVSIWKDGQLLRCRFNSQNQLVSVIRANGAPIEYAYDGFGRRISKKVGESCTRYIWAGTTLLAEISEFGGVRERRDYLFLPYTYCPLSLRINGSTYQYHTDHQGTPRWVTDAKGKIAWSADYEAFGGAKETIHGIRQPFRFPGHYFDEETGLHYNRARYYAPGLGRYLSRDPLGFLAGVNVYAYSGNDPINDCDPLGLVSFWKAVAAAAAVTAGVALMVVAAPVVLAGAAAVAAGSAVAAGTVGAIGMFVGGAALVGVGVGLGTTNDDQSVGNQALHVLKYGLIAAAGGASAILTVFGAAGMAAMAMGGGGGAVLCGVGGGGGIASSSAAPVMAAAGTLGMAATSQMAMSQAGEGGGSSEETTNQQGPRRRTQTGDDTTLSSEEEARAEALRRHGAADPEVYETEQVYGKNANLKGPNGEPYERVTTINGEGEVVEFEHHKWGHKFPDNTYEQPHFHGPNGEHISYPSGK